MDSSNSAFVSTQEMAEFDSQLFGNTLDANEAPAQQQAVEPSINTVKRRLHLEEMGAVRSRETCPWSPFHSGAFAMAIIKFTNLLHIFFIC